MIGHGVGQGFATLDLADDVVDDLLEHALLRELLEDHQAAVQRESGSKQSLELLGEHQQVFGADLAPALGRKIEGEHGGAAFRSCGDPQRQIAQVLQFNQDRALVLGLDQAFDDLAVAGGGFVAECRHDPSCGSPTRPA